MGDDGDFFLSIDSLFLGREWNYSSSSFFSFKVRGGLLSAQQKLDFFRILWVRALPRVLHIRLLCAHFFFQEPCRVAFDVGGCMERLGPCAGRDVQWGCASNATITGATGGWLHASLDGFLRCVNVVGDYMMMMTMMTNRLLTGRLAHRSSLSWFICLGPGHLAEGSGHTETIKRTIISISWLILGERDGQETFHWLSGDDDMLIALSTRSHHYLPTRRPKQTKLSGLSIFFWFCSAICFFFCFSPFHFFGGVLPVVELIREAAESKGMKNSERLCYNSTLVFDV